MNSLVECLAKVMQTALALRDTVLTLADMMVYILVYFVTSGIVLAALDIWLLLPFVLWLIVFVVILWIVIPELAKKQNNKRTQDH